MESDIEQIQSRPVAHKKKENSVLKQEDFMTFRENNNFKIETFRVDKYDYAIFDPELKASMARIYAKDKSTAI